MASEFTGKRILITGGANGVGKAIVKRFYEAGAVVFALDRDEDGLKNLKLEFPNVNPVLVDLLDWNASKKAVESILPLDHLVNNAGICKYAPVLDITEEIIDITFGVNFKAAYNLTRVFGRGIIDNKQNGGTIVNISSTGDTAVLGGVGTYCCSKAAITMLTKSSSQELGKYNIRVNCIRPTGMATQMFSEVNANPEVAEKAMDFMKRAALQGELQTSNVADLVYFLSSSQSSMITGEAVTIDAGASVA